MRKNIKANQHSPRYVALTTTVEKGKEYEIVEALALVKKTATAKFVESVDLAIRLGIDTRKSDQNVRGLTVLPHGTGKVRKVAVLAKGDLANEAEAAGADIVGAEDLIAKIQAGDKEAMSFDVILATEEMAPQIGKIGRILGQRTPNKRFRPREPELSYLLRRQTPFDEPRNIILRVNQQQIVNCDLLRSHDLFGQERSL